MFEELRIENINLIHIIVAYNSPSDILKLCEQINIQEEELHYVVFIDNSDDEFKNCNKTILKKFELFNITYIPLSSNLGSAGGFALGMKKAYEMGAEWLWLHDQDGYPLDNCLKNLRKHQSDYFIFSPKVIDEKNEYLKVFNGIYDKNWNLNYISLCKEINPTDVLATAGLMISRKVVDVIGVYDAKNFFIGQEDFDYCMRANRNGFKTVFIGESNYFHPNKWPINRTKSKRPLFLGQYNNRIEGGIIYYNVLYISRNFIYKFFYSIFYLLLKKIFRKEINLSLSLLYYRKGLFDRINNRIMKRIY